MDGKPTYVYTIYIESTAERVWQALTDAELSAEYWGHSNVSDWQVGSPWEHRRTDGSGIADVVGEILEASPPHRLVSTWADAESPDTTTTVIFEIEPFGAIVRLRVTHVDLPSDHDAELAASGWTAVFSNLKSLLETGHVLAETPWEMPWESAEH